MPGTPGSATGERTGEGGVNNLQVTDSAQVSIDLPTMEKSIVDPQTTYPVGATLTFSMTVGVPTTSMALMSMTPRPISAA